MRATFDPFSFVVISIAGWMNWHQQHVIDYLIEENRVLREQISDRRMRFKEVKKFGVRVGNWLSANEGHAYCWTSVSIIFKIGAASIAAPETQLESISRLNPSDPWLIQVMSSRLCRV